MLTPHFARAEARCRCRGGAGCGVLPRDVEGTAHRLESLRHRIGGRPIRVTSWYRCPAHPIEASKRPGALHRHTTGRAVDIPCGRDPELWWAIVEHARAAGFRSIFVYDWGLHLDWVDGDVKRVGAG